MGISISIENVQIYLLVEKKPLAESWSLSAF